MDRPQTKFNKDQFRKDWEEGVLLKDLASKYGVNMDTISRWAAHLGLEPRYRKQKADNALKGGEWIYDNKGIARWHWFDPTLHEAS